VADADAEPWRQVAPATAPHTAPVFIPAPDVPRTADLQRAAAVLNEGRKIAMLVGAGALHARQEVLALADLLAAPIVKTLPGKAAVPDDHPLTTGGIGLLGTRPSEEVMDSCDTLLMVGTNFPYTKHLPAPGQVKVVQIDGDPVRVGNRVPTDVPLVGDSAATLRALAAFLQPNRDKGFLERAQVAMGEWRGKLAAQEDPERDPIQPQYLMRMIDRHAATNAILCADSGTIATWSARHFDIRGDRQYFISGNLASMACALPYAIAAQWAHPGREVLAFVGDGGFAMLMAEVLTAVHHDLPVKIFVDNNYEYGQILWEQMVLGFPEFGVRHPAPANFADFVTANGGLGIRVDHAADVSQAVQAALAHPGVALVDCVTNPDEPPLPPKVTYEQAKGFAQSFLRGEPHKAVIASTLFHDKISELKH
jgi:pyruvate dehydrogenase (quinone)/pyruvate oxidase